jgi:hypothetical protein
MIGRQKAKPFREQFSDRPNRTTQLGLRRPPVVDRCNGAALLHLVPPYGTQQTLVRAPGRIIPLALEPAWPGKLARRAAECPVFGATTS